MRILATLLLIIPAGTINAFSSSSSSYTPTTPPIPPISPATSLPNRIYNWKHSQQIRYQTAGDPTSPHTAVLIHGLFVNSDHWRHTLTALADAGYCAYALDLWGCGYSSKPDRDSHVAKLVCGERHRFPPDEFDDENDVLTTSAGVCTTTNAAAAATTRSKMESPVLRNVELGTNTGGTRIADVELRHPMRSPYNFYTWGELIVDFTRDVVLHRQGKNAEDDDDDKEKAATTTTTLVCNSIGTISALQAILDEPDLFDGIFVVNPNFRELHHAEIPCPQLTMPPLRAVQKLLREKGHGLFELLAQPDIVRQILEEPYINADAVDDTLVSALLDPLLTPGSADVVFDMLSYSAGPLPEQQLSSPSFPSHIPAWVCYGESDPWTPPQRVERMGQLKPVERVIGLEDVGHCPHDEAPEKVNPLLLEFMERVKEQKTGMKTDGANDGEAIRGGRRANGVTDDTKSGNDAYGWNGAYDGSVDKVKSALKGKKNAGLIGAGWGVSGKTNGVNVAAMMNGGTQNVPNDGPINNGKSKEEVTAGGPLKETTGRLNPAVQQLIYSALRIVHGKRLQREQPRRPSFAVSVSWDFYLMSISV